jgi:hypothetical protein
LLAILIPECEAYFKEKEWQVFRSKLIMILGIKRGLIRKFKTLLVNDV